MPTKPATDLHHRRPREFRLRLLAWGRVNFRSFPWRTTFDPFAVLIAEVMLQRTQAPQAERIFQEFVGRYPNALAVVNANSPAVEAKLAGLGLRHRGRRIIELCGALVAQYGGNVPEDPAALRALPGVGPYTAGAVRCFGFGVDSAIVDRNIVRVLTRVFGYAPTAARWHNDRGMWALAESLVPPEQAAPFNFALLDFAAAVCTKRPRHDLCPMRDICCYYERQKGDHAAPEAVRDRPDGCVGAAANEGGESFRKR